MQKTIQTRKKKRETEAVEGFRMNIMGLDYVVLRVKSRSTELANMNGQGPNDSVITPLTNTIHMSQDMSAQSALSTIIHEIIHGILMHSGMSELLTNSDVSEEVLVLALENGLYRFIIDNDVDKIKAEIKSMFPD